MRRYNKAARGQRLLFNGIGAAVKIANRAYKEQQRENRRRERAVQSYLAKCEREAAAAERQRIREAERYAREQARLAKENEKLQKKLQFEAEVQSIIEENEEWTTIHTEVSTLISENDLIQAINDAEFEKNEVMYQGLFEDPIPQKAIYEQKAKAEADVKHNTNAIAGNLRYNQTQLGQLQFNEIEPTEESVSIELTDEAKNSIKAFWPWKKKRLVNEYVQENLRSRLKEKHELWSKAKKEYESKLQSLTNEVRRLESELQNENSKKVAFINSRTQQLYNQDFTTWKSKRDRFYDDYLANLHGLLNGEASFVENALIDTLSDNDLPMEYFVESMYDESTGVVRLDVDLPEIEDIPQQKIVLTSTGKQSIRNKAAKDLNEDYVQCICGLAIFLAEDMFNVSPKIQHVEISGFTQRQDSKTSLVTDQYVYVINFDRDTFNKINFEKFSAIQVFSFFQHHINATKTMILKELDMNTAYDKVKQYVPVDYDEFLLQNPDYAKTSSRKSTSKSSVNSSNQNQTSTLSAFARASILRDKLHTFVSKLDTSDIEKHANSLKGVNINIANYTFVGTDCDIKEYRGKLFFVCVADLYNSLKQMGVDIYNANEELYVLALMINKIYTQLQPESSNMTSILSAAHAFNTTFASMIDSIPTVPHKFLILEIMSDYRDLSYYRQYHTLLKELAGFVDDNCGNNSHIKRLVRSYISQLNEYSL